MFTVNYNKTCPSILCFLLKKHFFYCYFRAEVTQVWRTKSASVCLLSIRGTSEKINGSCTIWMLFENISAPWYLFLTQHPLSENMINRSVSFILCCCSKERVASPKSKSEGKSKSFCARGNIEVWHSWSFLDRNMWTSTSVEWSQDNRQMCYTFCMQLILLNTILLFL